MNRHKVLLVDDEPMVLTALKRLLRKEPYEVFTVNSAEKALDFLAENRVSLLVSDHRMPGMTGVELMGIVCEKYPDAIRIILTGFMDAAIAIDAINDGKVYSFLKKPWDNNHLKKTIANGLEEYELRAKMQQMRRQTDEQRQESDLVKPVSDEVGGWARREVLEIQKMKQDFAALAMHELRTPLVCMVSCVHMLQDFGQMSDGEKKVISEALLGATSRLESVVEDVLNVIEVNQKRLPDSVEMSINDIAKKVADEIRPCLNKRKLALSLNLADDLLCHCGDPKKIWQVITNLVMNAIRFTPDGGEIRIESKAENDKVLLVVSDTGIGIPAEEQHNIFEPFYEVNDTLNHSSGTIEFMSGSMGLGLFIAKTIMERHGGTISVSSSPGKGSTFTVELPVKENSCEPKADIVC